MDSKTVSSRINSSRCGPSAVSSARSSTLSIIAIMSVIVKLLIVSYGNTFEYTVRELFLALTERRFFFLVLCDVCDFLQWWRFHFCFREDRYYGGSV